MSDITPPSLTVRVATEQDIHALASLNAEVQRIHFVAEPLEYKEPNLEATMSFFDGAFENDDFIVLLAELDGTPAGYLMAEVARRKENAIKHGANFLYIHHVATNQEFRRTGVATALLNHAGQYSVEQELSDLRLNTGSFNEGAQAFFQSQGFHTFEYRMLRKL